jgi:hypothetical protein
MTRNNQFFFLLFILAGLVAGPFVLIWSLNTVFPALAIEYTFWTWLSMLFLVSALNGAKAASK